MAGYSFEKYKPKPKKSRGRSGGRSGSRGGSRGSSGGSSRGRPSGGSRGRDSGRSRSGGSRSGGSRSSFSRGRSDNSRGREFRGRESGSDYKRKDNRNSDRTAVKCSGCGMDCFVPFKPMTNKPLFCDDCYGEKNAKPKKRGRDESPKSSGVSEHQLDIINEKLNKIMKALNLD